MAVDKSMQILIVDDYKTMLRIIRNLLKQLGFNNVDEATDGAAALVKLRSKEYGMVISDWNMEPMTGYELLKEVRADQQLKNLPFIMVTAESKTDNVIAAKKGTARRCCSLWRVFRRPRRRLVRFRERRARRIHGAGHCFRAIRIRPLHHVRRR